MLLALLGILASPPAAARADVAGPVVLVGVPGVRWSDVSADATPALWSLLQNGAAGTLATRSVNRQACPVDGWLAVSAGRRAAAARSVPDDQSPDDPADDDAAPLCSPIPAPSDGAVPGWAGYVETAAGDVYDARLGLLGDALAGAGVSATALGPGAAVALARTDGSLDAAYRPAPSTVGGYRTAAEGATTDLLVVDAGAVRDPVDLSPADPDSGRDSRAAQVAAVDTRVAALLDGLPAGATVLVAAIADSGLAAHLQLVAATGPGPQSPYADALLVSRSTRQPGIVQTTDLTPTLLDLLSVPAPGGLVGAPVTALSGSPADAGERLRQLLDLAAAAQAVQPLVPWFFNGLVAAQLVLYGAAALALRNGWGGPRHRGTVLAVVRRVAVLFAAVPVATFLANLLPWWRAGSDFAAVVGAVTLFAVAVSAVALLGPWRDRPLGPLGAVAGITAGVLAADVLAGSRLITSSLMGLQPVVAGRFYGLGNVQYALFATGSLLLATALADAALRAGRRRLAVAVVVVVGLVEVVVNGHPALGADFGGPPSTVPAFTLLALLVAGVRVTWAKATAIAAGTLAVVAGLSVLDWLRPPDERTHLGRFVATVLDGGAWQVVERKLAQNLDILFTSVLSALVPVAALFVALVLMRPGSWGASALAQLYQRSPALRPGLVSLIVMLAIGFAVNDSGTAVPAVAATLAIPLLIAASVRVLERDGPGAAVGAVSPATPGPGGRGDAPGAAPAPAPRPGAGGPGAADPASRSR